MHKPLAFAALVPSLFTMMLAPLFVSRTSALAANFTHATLDEDFTYTSWSGCQADETSHLAEYDKYTAYEPNTVHSLHMVSFHPYGPFANQEAQSRAAYYSITGYPSHIVDGGHQKALGPINEDMINYSGVRQVHRLEMTLSKSVTSSVLSFNGTVTNLENTTFNGFMLMFIVENQLFDSGITWNFVFRDYGLNKSLSLDGLSTTAFSGTWNTPVTVNASKTQVIAAAFDTSELDTVTGRPYAVQSVCDGCGQTVAVPEYENTWLYLLPTVLIVTASPILLHRRPSSHNHHRKS